MNFLRRALRKAHLDQVGATAVEYGIMVALIAVVIIGAVTALGNNVNDAFDDVNSGFTEQSN